MTKDDIIRMAREAGAIFPADGSYHCFEIPGTLERFASLIAAHEREIFCSVLRQLHDSYSLPSDPTTIRARGQA